MHHQRRLRHGDTSVKKRPYVSHAIPAVERFWALVEKTDGCWVWTGGCTHHGYGRFFPDLKGVAAHRFAYEVLVGPIPDGYEVDHLCHTSACPGGNTCPHRRCVNPAHLEAVTKRLNMHRQPRIRAFMEQTHCAHGHEYTPENTYVSPSRAGRQCQVCRRAAEERRRAKASGAAA